MAIKGLTLSSVERYISDEDPAKAAEGQEGATVFILGPIDVFITGSVLDKVLIQSNEGIPRQVMLNRLYLETVRFGLRGWENFQDSAGHEIKYETNKVWVANKEYTVVSDECLVQMPLAVMRDLSQRIQRLNTVTEAEAKN